MARSGRSSLTWPSCRAVLGGSAPAADAFAMVMPPDRAAMLPAMVAPAVMVAAILVAAPAIVAAAVVIATPVVVAVAVVTVHVVTVAVHVVTVLIVAMVAVLPARRMIAVLMRRCGRGDRRQAQQGRCKDQLLHH